ncbi:MAG TPA: AraC family transcriptional regulator [Balneolaceae bacterium]
MDVLSDVLRVVRLQGALFFSTRFTSPWAFDALPAERLARLMQTRAESISLFHIFIEGECWISLEDQEPFLMEKGCGVIFPHSPVHRMRSNPRLSQAKPFDSLLPLFEGDIVPNITYGGKGDLTRFICGYLECDYRFNPLLGALPPVILISPPNSSLLDHISEDGPIQHSNVIITDSNDWLGTTLGYIIKETEKKDPGCSTIISRLTELLFVEALRRYMQQLPVGQRGWLAGLNDPQTGRVIRLMHEQPEKKWTVEKLAHSVGVSRSVLAGRFTELVGESPMQYLTNWRMQLARFMIRQSEQSFAEIAAQVGYNSDIAFSRAFKRLTGQTPAKWREQIK